MEEAVFSPLSENENEFFVASEAGASEMKKGDLTKAYIPIFTTPKYRGRRNTKYMLQ